MPRTAGLLAAALIAATSLPVQAEPNAPMTYPETRRGDVAETLFGERIADPYRWLENDVRHDPEVADWVRRQNGVTQTYLVGLPQRARVRVARKQRGAIAAQTRLQPF